METLTKVIKDLTLTGKRARTDDDMAQLKIYHPQLVEMLLDTIGNYQTEEDDERF